MHWKDANINNKTRAEDQVFRYSVYVVKKQHIQEHTRPIDWWYCI